MTACDTLVSTPQFFLANLSTEGNIICAVQPCQKVIHTVLAAGTGTNYVHTSGTGWAWLGVTEVGAEVTAV